MEGGGEEVRSEANTGHSILELVLLPGTINRLWRGLKVGTTKKKTPKAHKSRQRVTQEAITKTSFRRETVSVYVTVTVGFVRRVYAAEYRKRRPRLGGGAYQINRNHN